MTTGPHGEALGDICDLLSSHGVRYMLVGGLAVFAHSTERTTKDIDLAVDVTQTDERALRDILGQMGHPVEGPIESEFGTRYLIHHPVCIIETFLVGRHDMHQREFDRALRARVYGRECLVLSLEDLLLRKLVNTRIRRAEKDIFDLKALVTMNWETLDREYVRRHGAVHRVVPLFEDLLSVVEEERGNRIP